MTNKLQFSFLIVFAIGLVAISALRWASFEFEDLAHLQELPTLLFVGWGVGMAIIMSRVGLSFRSLVIEPKLRFLPHLLLGAFAALLVILQGDLLEPVWTSFFGEVRNLERFAEPTQSLFGLIMVLVFSWTFAAVGEEIVFRGVLMRGLVRATGGSALVLPLILLFQALVFGLVHAYQGPVGVASATVSGLIFGVVVLISKGSLWPAIFAHGFANSYSLISLWLVAGLGAQG